MSWDEDDYDDGSWGYDGDPVHDQWVDYDTDMYEDSNYSGENPDWEEYPDDFADDDFEVETTCQLPNDYSRQAQTNLSALPSQSQIGRLEKKVHYLEGALAASLLTLNKWEEKAERASSPKNMAKYQRHIEKEKARIADYRSQLDKTKSLLGSTNLNNYNRNTYIAAFVGGALVMLCIMLAFFI